MSHIVYRIATDARTDQADDLSGAGAKQTGGRWNEPGIPALYASESRALACLETLVHLNAGGLPLNRYLVEIAIPAQIWSNREHHTPQSLPVGWDAEPASQTSIAFGTLWLRANRTPVLVLPSVIVPEEITILINPTHPAATAITAQKRRRWTYDPRMSSVAATP